MTALDFSDAPHPVRADIGAAHGSFFERLAGPGTWWCGAERVAIAAAVRASAGCALCRERRAALSPRTTVGEHAGAGDLLPAAAVEAIHQIASDPARLSRSWLEKLRAGGLADGAYVELVGIVSCLISIDAFCRGIGLPPHPLPEPRPGEPSRYRPTRLERDTAWVPMIPADGASGPEADLWTGTRTGNVIRALSLVPDAVRELQVQSTAHYLPFDQVVDFGAGSRSLDRVQIELVAARVSALSECFY